MKISIITPNFNGGKYIENCIKSVLSQGVNFEHIIVDSKSTDSSIKIFDKYPHLKIISEKDKGMYYAINSGIEICDGDIIAYLNSDDRYPVDTLKKVLSVFNDNLVDYVYGNCKLIDQFENEIYVYKVPPISRNLLKKITVVPWAQPSMFFRRCVFDSLGNFNIKYVLASDYHFMKKVIHSNLKGVGIRSVLSEFMVREDALSAKYLEEMKLEGIQVKNDLKISDKPVIDFFFNIYRKLFNFHTFFKKI
jgi:glycosyltransferase involved in cell wall biosynthesis